MADNLFSGISNVLSGGETQQGLSDFGNAVNTLQASMPSELANYIPVLTKQVVQGTMTPATAQAAIQQQSALNGIQLNPQMLSAQMGALAQIQKVATSGGMTDTDKAQLQDMNNSVNAQNAGRQLAVQQQMQSQGTAGSGADIAARMASAQTANETAGQNAVQVAGNAQQRALQAMSTAGNLAGNIQGQQYGEAANTASAQNAINQFNAQNQQQTNLANQNAQQNANTQNFQTANQVAGTNTGIANTQAMLPLNTAVTQNTQNETAANNTAQAQEAAGKANQAQGNTQYGQTNNMLTGLSNSGVGSTIASFFSDPKVKKDVHDVTDDDIDSMLEKLSGKTYKYDRSKVPNAPSGKRVGVMAPDVKKSGIGDVERTEDGKQVVIDNDNLKGHMMAALSNLHDRVKQLEGK